MAFAQIGTRGVQAQSIDLDADVTGSLPVANGGTGLASGTTGQFLKFTGSTTLAPAEAGVGKIGQVISQTLAPCQSSTSGTSYVGTSFSIDITPSATTSKIYVTFNCGGIYHSTSMGGLIRVRYNDDTTIFNTGSYTSYRGTSDMQIGSSCAVLHSPSTTSQKNYKIEMANRSANGTFYIGHPC